MVTPHVPAREASVIAPEDFVHSGRRLFIDTNVFMDTDAERATGLKRLFERCKDVAIENGNGIVVPTKVVEELKKKSHLDTADLAEDRSAAFRRAGQWLVALESAATVGLVRTDLGDGSNPYADDLFVDLFTRFGNKYDMCLLTNDITLRLRIRLLGAESGHRLLAGAVAADGRIGVDSDQHLYERGSKKLSRITQHIDEGLGKPKDHYEVAILTPILENFRRTFTIVEAPARPGERPANRPPIQRAEIAFRWTTTLKQKDQALGATTIPTAGTTVILDSKDGRCAVMLGDQLGEGGEGSVFAVAGDPGQVVKIFDAEHRTAHRMEKIGLLLSHNLASPGIGFPTSLIKNSDGEFVGYAMPRATGKALQATIMRPSRFKRMYPNWTKADLVDVCISFLEKVAYLHSLNILLGDINPKNLMVDESKNVWIIDADSWQIEGYPCPVGTPMFTAPTITGEYSETLRTSQEELFAVATMLFMILITGQFPYARAGADGGDFATLIKEGKFTFQFQGPSDRDQPNGNWKFMWSHLPPKVKSLFWNTFHQNGNRYDRRPTANEWLGLFKDYRAFFGSADDFDPMSNDVYPFRFRAFRPDTPIRDCAQCQRRNAIAGQWDDDSHSYYVPTLCYDCNQSKSTCPQCGKRRPAGALIYDGRCWKCYQKRDHATCSNCGRETRERYLVNGLCSNCQLVACGDCRTPTPKSQLTYGRCPACQSRQATLDGSRLCTRCGKPFITHGNVAWHQRSNKPVPTSHKHSDPACVVADWRPRVAAANRGGAAAPRGGSATTRPPDSRSPGTVRPQQQTPVPGKKGFWARLADWFQN